MAADTRVTGPGVVQLKALAVRLKDADPRLRRELRKALREAARPAAKRAQASILAMPSHHGGTLRGEVAKTVTVRVPLARQVQVEIVAEPRKMPEGKQSLPAHLNSARGWNHPVFGRDTWRHQTGREGWFDDSIARSARDVQHAAEGALEVTARHLAG